MNEDLSLHKVVLPNDLVGPPTGVGWEVGFWDSQFNDIVSDSNEETFKNVQSLSRKIVLYDVKHRINLTLLCTIRKI